MKIHKLRLKTHYFFLLNLFRYSWKPSLNKRKILQCLFHRHDLDLEYKVGQEDTGMGKGGKMLDNGKRRMNFLGFLHMA